MYLGTKRIIGTFYRQIMDGYTSGHIVDDGDEKFDATTYILGMDAQAIHGIVDRSETSDGIGISLVDWSGPYSVEIEQAICHFFEVESVEDVTDEMIEQARREQNETPSVDVFLYWKEEGLDENDNRVDSPNCRPGRLNFESGDIEWMGMTADPKEIKDLKLSLPVGKKYPCERINQFESDQGELARIAKEVGCEDKRNNLCRIRANVEVIYDLCDVPMENRRGIEQKLASYLQTLVERAHDDGLLTGDIAAYVESTDVQIGSPTKTKKTEAKAEAIS